MEKITFIGDFLLIIYFRNFGVSLRYLLNRYNIKRSTFYSKFKLFFIVNNNSKLSKRSYFKGYSLNTNGEKVYDEHIKRLLIDLLLIDDPSNPEFFYKTLGSKKLSIVFKQKYGIIINHKKIYRLRKELNLTRNYHRHSKHPRKRPRNHDISSPNQYWEADIKFVFTKANGFVGILSIIDAFDRSIVGVYIGNSIKAKDFINTVKQAIKFRNATPKNLIIRTDNGPQFKANITDIFMNELNIIHEFGYKNNPNSQAFIESFHSSVQREFVEYITFNDINDVYNYYISYIYFYNHLRPHGSLKYLTPDYVFNLFNDFISSYDFSDFFCFCKKMSFSYFLSIF